MADLNDKAKRSDLLARWKGLKDDRRTWDPHWQEIADYILPRRGRWAERDGDRKSGKKRRDRIIDGTAGRALRTLASGMHSGLTSPSRPWFRLGMEDQAAERDRAVKAWLASVERIMYQAFARSNFYSSVHSAYYELGAFGTTAILELETDPRSTDQPPFRFHPLTVGTYWIEADEDGRVDTFYRQYWMTARNMVARWGEDKVSREAAQNAKDNPYKTHEVLLTVCPRGETQGAGHRAGSRLVGNQDMPWEATYLEVNGGSGTMGSELLEVSGFNEMPLLCPRWTVTAEEVYGRGPGMEALADTKMLQAQRTTGLRAIQKMVDPPLRVPANYKGRISLLPGAINHVDTVMQKDGVGPMYDLRFDVGAAAADIAQTRMAVRESFYNDLFLMILENPNMTATEVLERKQEKMFLLGPIIERQQNELLDPLVDRTFAMLHRAGAIPEAPPPIQGQPLRVEYVSVLAQAQKMTATAGIDRVVAFAGQLEALRPGAMDMVDTDFAIETYADLLGVPPELIRGSEAATEIRKARVEQQQAQQQAQDAQAAASTAKTLSETSLGGGSALDRMLGGER